MSDEAMNDETPPEVTPRVRPRFRKFAIAAFILLVPIALFTLWDYIEARRLGAAVKALREAKQPLTTQPSNNQAMRPDNAARYYDAASALVDLSDTSGPKGLLQRLDGEPPSPELIAELRAVLDRNHESERLLQRATELEFYGPVFGSDYLWSRASSLSRLSALRATERISSGDPEGAARAVLQDLRLVRPLSWNALANTIQPVSLWSAAAARRALRALPEVLELNPSTATVERLVREVAALDHDDAIEQSIVLERAFLVRTFWDEPHQWYARPWRQVVPQPMWQVLRPWFGHRAVSLIALMNEYQSVARRPWPGRLGTMAQITEPGPPRAIGSITGPYSAEIFRYQHGRTVGSIADRLALTRAASTLLALELYRRAHDNRLPDAMSGLVPEYLPAVPIDPYSGQEIRYRRDGERVMTYSVGRNRKDDGGEKLGEGPSRRWGIYREEQPPPDIGLMMRVSGGNK